MFLYAHISNYCSFVIIFLVVGVCYARLWWSFIFLNPRQTNEVFFYLVYKYSIVLVNVKSFRALCGFDAVQNK